MVPMMTLRMPNSLPNAVLTTDCLPDRACARVCVCVLESMC